MGTAAKLPVNPRSTCYQLSLIRTDFSSSSSASVPHEKQYKPTKLWGSALWPAFGTSQGSRCLERGARQLWQGCNMSPPSAAVSCSWEGGTGERSCGQQRQEPRNGDRGTRHSAAGCLFLHREHTTKLGHIHLCVLESSSSEMALVDGPLCQDGVQILRGCGADRQRCQPRFPSFPSLVL